MGNKKYLDEIKLKNHEIEFQKMVLDISFEFMNIDSVNFDDSMNNLLKCLGVFFNVDRTYLIQLNHMKITIG